MQNAENAVIDVKSLELQVEELEARFEMMEPVEKPSCEICSCNCCGG
jgi:hypothetical protein